MITSLILCIVSGLFLATIWYGKRLEHDGGRPLIILGSENIDQKLSLYYLRKKQYIRSIDRRYMKDKLHLAAENLERWGIFVAEKAVNTFSRTRDIVSGRDVPKDLPRNKGAAAFFFRHIETAKRLRGGKR